MLVEVKDVKKAAVLVDSAADITDEQAKDLGVYVIRMNLNIDGTDYIEYDDISGTELLNRMKAGAIVKTSQPPLGRMIECWESLLEEYERILYIPISSKLSGTYQTAVITAQDYDNKVVVADALSACAPIQYLAKCAVEMIDKGYELEEIKERIEDSYMFAAIMPSNLVYLKRGGRISPAAAALGNLLKIVPVLSVNHGEIDVLDKVRTIRKAYTVGMTYAANVPDKDNYEWMLVYADIDKATVDLYVEEFEKMVQHPVKAMPVLSIITSHTGPCLGVGRIKKIRY